MQLDKKILCTSMMLTGSYGGLHVPSEVWDFVSADFVGRRMPVDSWTQESPFVAEEWRWLKKRKPETARLVLTACPCDSLPLVLF